LVTSFCLRKAIESSCCRYSPCAMGVPAH